MTTRQSSRSISPIGSEVEVDLLRLNEKLPEYVFSQLKNDPKGIVIDYKMTDGTGVGFVVKFKNDYKYWFFQEEIIGLSKEKSGHEINLDKFITIENNNLNHKIEYLLNPKSFINWFLYSIKDII